jgi:hypothetical protein
LEIPSLSAALLMTVGFFERRQDCRSMSGSAAKLEAGGKNCARTPPTDLE